MDNIEDVVKRVMENISSHHPQQSANIYEVFQKLLNSDELKHVRIVGENAGVLFVYVDSPTWLYQLNIKKNHFLNQIKKNIPQIKDIRFQIGQIKS